MACKNLNSRTYCIMLTMLERMHLTCCVLPLGKALDSRCTTRDGFSSKRKTYLPELGAKTNRLIFGFTLRAITSKRLPP